MLKKHKKEKNQKILKKRKGKKNEGNFILGIFIVIYRDFSLIEKSRIFFILKKKIRKKENSKRKKIFFFEKAIHQSINSTDK